MSTRYIMLGNKFDGGERLYFDDIDNCQSRARLNEWLRTAEENADTISSQIEVFVEVDGDKEDVWYSRAVKALMAYRSAQRKLKRRLAEIGANDAKAAA